MFGDVFVFYSSPVVLSDLIYMMQYTYPHVFFSFAEVWVAIFFVLLALLWLTREPEFVDGWGSLLEEGYV